MSNRQLILNCFLYPFGHHEVAWRQPQVNPQDITSLDTYSRHVQRLEAAKFDSVFLADDYSVGFDIRRNLLHALDPITLLCALSVRTKHIGLISTASTTFSTPYDLARKFASLDHLSGGRAGWNVVTAANPDAARNFGLDGLPDHDERYREAHEFVEVARALWDSWADDTLVGDQEEGIFADPDKIVAIAHDGKYFRCQGPLNIPRSPQGHPVLLQAGSSPQGRAFASEIADAVFTVQPTLASAQAFYSDVKERAAAAGRDQRDVKILPGLVPVIGASEQEAIARNEELNSMITIDYSLQQLSFATELELTVDRLDEPLPPLSPSLKGAQGWGEVIAEIAHREQLTIRQLLPRLAVSRGHMVVFGTGEQIADQMEHWFQNGAADGFNILPPLNDDGIDDFATQVIPHLQRRGLFRTEYTGTTLRDHYGLTRPPSPHRTSATAGV